MDAKKIIGLLLLLLVFGFGWYFLTQQTIPAPGTSSTDGGNTSNGTSDSNSPINNGKINVGFSSRGLANKSDAEIMQMLEETRNKVNTMSDQLGNAVRSGSIDKASPQYKDINQSIANLQFDFKALQSEAIKRGLTIS